MNMAAGELRARTEYYFQPTRPELAELYSGCGVFLCPSWHEGLGMPSMEAMATGSLLVTTDTGGSRDFAVHGETALVSPARDCAALAENLATAVTDWDGLADIRTAGRKRIQSFRWDANLDTFEGVVRDLCAKSGNAAQ